MRPVTEPAITLAIDPGGITGVAWCAGDDPTVAGASVGGEVPGGRFGFYDWFGAFVERGYPFKAIICEDFLVTAKTAQLTQQPDAMRVIGYLEAWTHQHGVPFVLQTPSTAKSFATNPKLRHFGWYTSSAGGHSNDAFRHLLTYLAVRDRNPHVLDHLKALA